MTPAKLPKTNLLLLALLLIGPVVAFGQTAPLNATLQLSPDTTLPGTPVAFMITITNPGEQLAKIANALSLKVTMSSSVFDAKGQMSRDTVTLPLDQMEKIGTG